MARAALLGLGPSLACLLPALAFADAAVSEPPAYRPLVEQALAEMKLGHFDEAHTQFLEAHRMFPSARTLRGLGFVAFEQRHYVEAVALLEQALASTTKPLDGALRTERGAGARR